MLVVCWAKDRFPPADDGSFYHVVAQRIAHGQGYTWLWPDGAVSYAAHYPVGYPALLGLAYAVFGSRPVVAMLLNAALGALAVFAAQRCVIRYGSRRRALIAGLLLALHPGLLFYTPALMTEGVTAEMLVVAAWLSLRVGSSSGFRWRLLALGACLGGLCLVRPQLLLMAPIFGFLALEASETRYLARAPACVAGYRRGARRVPAVDAAKLRSHGSLRVRQRQRRLEPADRFGARGQRRVDTDRRRERAARVSQRVR